MLVSKPKKSSTESGAMQHSVHQQKKANLKHYFTG